MPQLALHNHKQNCEKCSKIISIISSEPAGITFNELKYYTRLGSSLLSYHLSILSSQRKIVEKAGLYHPDNSYFDCMRKECTLVNADNYRYYTTKTDIFARTDFDYEDYSSTFESAFSKGWYRYFRLDGINLKFADLKQADFSHRKIWKIRIEGGKPHTIEKGIVYPYEPIFEFVPRYPIQKLVFRFENQTEKIVTLSVSKYKKTYEVPPNYHYIVAEDSIQPTDILRIIS